MRTIYIDSNYICHATDDGTRTAIETDAFDNVCDVALECYKFIPAHEDKVDFIQCFDSVTADKLQKQYQMDLDNSIPLEEASELMDEIEDLCNELIGE